jgi:hypothetical protein
MVAMKPGYVTINIPPTGHLHLGPVFAVILSSTCREAAKPRKLAKLSVIFLNSSHQEKDDSLGTLNKIWNTIQIQILPCLEQEPDPLSHKEREFVQLVSLLELPSHMPEFRQQGFGKRKMPNQHGKGHCCKVCNKLEPIEILIQYLRNCNISIGESAGHRSSFCRCRQTRKRSTAPFSLMLSDTS